VCGCCGGAGASTFAYLIALAAARNRSEPVLVADTGGTGGGLAYFAGVVAPHSLAEIAESLAAGLAPGRPFATASDGLRVLATGPRLAAGCTREGVELVLDDARVAHSLTVVDCGTLTREADQIALAKASHIAWVLPATRSGVRRASRMLEAINPEMRGREAIVARRDEREAKAALADLKRIASARHATLILVPHLPDLGTANATDALETAQVSLQAIHGLLER
jgi:Flp pilus assembly CpaE family ATPase